MDLYCFYLFLQREGSEDTLDFWLDVQQHENLCRAYFKDLTKSGQEGPEIVEQDWPRYAFYAKTRGSIYNKFTGLERDYDMNSDDEYDALGGRRSGEGASSEGHESLARGAEAQWRGGQRSGYEQNIDGGEDEDDAEKLSSQDHSRLTPPNAAYPHSNTLKALYPFDKEASSSTSLPIRRSSSPFQRKRASTTQPFIQRSSAISRTDLISSAERIYSRYLMPGSEKEVFLPSDIRITQFNITSSSLPSPNSPLYESEANEQAKVPDMFHLQKEFIYNQMRAETFPRFLRAKGFGNLTELSSLIRLGIGLMSLWIGLATAFAFVFLDTQPRETRLWVSYC